MRFSDFLLRMQLGCFTRHPDVSAPRWCGMLKWWECNCDRFQVDPEIADVMNNHGQ
jgi:hypothetical protein